MIDKDSNLKRVLISRLEVINHQTKNFIVISKLSDFSRSLLYGTVKDSKYFCYCRFVSFIFLYQNCICREQQPLNGRDLGPAGHVYVLCSSLSAREVQESIALLS
jgi:hypothetical protein